MKELEKNKEYYIKLNSQEDYEIIISYLKKKGFNEYGTCLDKFYSNYPYINIYNNLNDPYFQSNCVNNNAEEILVSDLKESKQEYLKPEDLVKGKYYTMKWNWNNSDLILEVIEKEKYQTLEAICYDITRGNLNKDWAANIKELSNIKEATKEEVLKYFPDEKFEDDISEYVELIQEYHRGVIGQVLKVINYKQGFFEDHLGKNFINTQTLIHKYLKPSTKEAFDKQNSKSEKKEEDLTGRYIKVLRYIYSGVDEGDYLKITQDRDNVIDTINLSNVKDFWNKNRLKDGDFELMPKGFSPSEEIKQSEVIMESNLDKAKRLYPIGTKYIGLRDNKKEESLNEPVICGNNNIYVGFDYIYKDGKWAEIVEDKVESNLVHNKYYKCQYKDSKNIWYFQFDWLDFSDDKLYHLGIRSCVNLDWGPKSWIRYSQNCDFQEVTEQEAKGIEEEKWVPKVGDWIKVINNTTYGCKLKVGDIEQIYHILSNLWCTTKRLRLNGGDINFVDIVKALPHEIPTTNKSSLDNFPEKWFIKWKNEEIFKAVNKHFKKDWDYVSDSCVDYSGDYHSYNCLRTIPKECIEISFEQFKAKYIDNQLPEEPIRIDINLRDNIALGKGIFHEINKRHELSQLYKNPLIPEECFPAKIQLLSKPKLVPIKIESESKINTIKQLKTIKINYNE